MTTMLLQHAVDEAFGRMSAIYGREFTGKFDGEDADGVRRQWCRELAMVPNTLDAIAWALKRLPERAPNARQFCNLCALAPPPGHQYAMPVTTEPARPPTMAEREHLRQLRNGIASGSLFAKPGRDWAMRLILRARRGERLSGFQLTAARDALHLPKDGSGDWRVVVDNEEQREPA